MNIVFFPYLNTQSVIENPYVRENISVLRIDSDILFYICLV